MYIIDRNKDYYDYHSHIYGIDKKIVFDRRGSNRITDSDIISLLPFPVYKNIPIRNKYFILLEVGYVQYLIKVFDIELEDDFKLKDFKMEIVYTYKNNKHYFESPISIYSVSMNYFYKLWFSKEYVIGNSFKEDITKINKGIELPILADTYLTSLIDSDIIWKELQNYISSLNNDRDVDLKMTDVEKAVNHGFDKKTSFRNPIK